MAEQGQFWPSQKEVNERLDTLEKQLKEILDLVKQLVEELL